MGQCFFAFDPVDIYVVNCYNATSNEHNHDEFALALQTITGFNLLQYQKRRHCTQYTTLDWNDFSGCWAKLVYAICWVPCQL